MPRVENRCRLAVPLAFLAPARGHARLLGGLDAGRRNAAQSCRRTGTGGPARGRPNRLAGEPGRHAAGNPSRIAGPAAASPGPVAQRPVAGRVRQDGGSADPRPGNGRDQAARRDSDGNGSLGPGRSARESDRTACQGASQLYRADLHSRRDTVATEQCGRGSQGLRRRGRRDGERIAQHFAAAGERAAARGGDPLGAGLFHGRPADLRLRQSVQHASGTGCRLRPGVAHVAGGRRAVRCAAGWGASLRVQLGRPPPAAGRSDRSCRPRNGRAGGPGTAYRL